MFHNRTENVDMRGYVQWIKGSIQFSSIQFNSIQFNSIQFNLVQFNSAVGDEVNSRSSATVNMLHYYVLVMRASYLFLNWFTVFDSRIWDGRLFQSLAPRTEKKFFRMSRFARGTLRGMNECCCLVFGWLTLFRVNRVSLLTSRKPLRYLKTSIASPRFRLSSRVVKFNCCSRSG